jgi:hypothetical protein
VAAQQSHEGAPDGFVRVPLGTVAEQAGCSPQRASVHIGVLESAGVVEKRIDRRWVEVADRETGEITSRMQSEQYLRFLQPPTETLQTLTTITPERPAATGEKPKTWGGSRGGCPEHPEAGTVTRWTKACTACGRILDRGERPDDAKAGGLILQDERSGSVTGAAELTTESTGDHAPDAHGERSDAHVPPYHCVPAVHPVGHHGERSARAPADDGRARRRDGDG